MASHDNPLGPQTWTCLVNPVQLVLDREANNFLPVPYYYTTLRYF